MLVEGRGVVLWGGPTLAPEVSSVRFTSSSVFEREFTNRNQKTRPMSPEGCPDLALQGEEISPAQQENPLAPRVAYRRTN